MLSLNSIEVIKNVKKGEIAKEYFRKRTKDIGEINK